MKLVGLVGLLALVVVASARADFLPAESTPPAPPRVTMVSDSVGAALLWHPDARIYLAEGIDFKLQALACRRLVVLGCEAPGTRPPSALDTIRELGTELGPVVVIDVGYNDPADEFAGGIDPVMQALVAAKVRRVVWVTLAEHEDVWAENNAAIHAAAARWRQMVIADWAPLAADHPDWFDDIAHLNEEGAMGFAHLLRPILLAALAG